jgi:GTP-binding protein
MSNIIAIVGRPNVGKSTLFNRLVGKRQAITDETSGVTRDRHYGKSTWNGFDFSVIDTGGYVTNSDDVFETEINKQVVLAIEESDVILFLVDVKSGITEIDKSISKMLMRTDKPVLLVVNKVDNSSQIDDTYEFFSLGLGEIYSISSTNGSGTGDLLDEVVKKFKTKTIETDLGIPKYAIVGRPNAGKSSLINALIGEERNIVTEVAGTTRDSIHTRYKKFGQDFLIIDTAGLRKKTKVSEDIEFYSVMRAVKTIEEADVCLLMIDATRGMEAQDLNIFSLIEKNKKGVVIIINKWDLIEKETNTSKEYEENVRNKLAPFNDVPIIFTSAITKQRIHKVLETATEVYENRVKRIPTSKLNEYMLQVIDNYQPPSVKGKFVKIKYVTQLPTHTPNFAFYCNMPQYITTAYKRYLENKIRDEYNFTGVPIQIFMRKK